MTFHEEQEEKAFTHPLVDKFLGLDAGSYPEVGNYSLGDLDKVPDKLWELISTILDQYAQALVEQMRIPRHLYIHGGYKETVEAQDAHIANLGIPKTTKDL